MTSARAAGWRPWRNRATPGRRPPAPVRIPGSQAPALCLKILRAVPSHRRQAATAQLHPVGSPVATGGGMVLTTTNQSMSQPSRHDPITNRFGSRGEGSDRQIPCRRGRMVEVGPGTQSGQLTRPRRLSLVKTSGDSRGTAMPYPVSAQRRPLTGPKWSRDHESTKQRKHEKKGGRCEGRDSSSRSGRTPTTFPFRCFVVSYFRDEFDS
jgi:hypothetical protein